MRKFLSLILSATFMTVFFVGLDVLRGFFDNSTIFGDSSATTKKKTKIDLFGNLTKVIIFHLIVRIKDITFRKLYRIF